MKIYAAYGSNMNLTQMSLRCPQAKVCGKGELKGYRLTFRGGSGGGVANVEMRRGRSVPIVLWWITPECEKALDRYEGFPHLYEKKLVEVETPDGPVIAMIYVMAERYERMPSHPSGYYFGIIRQGYYDNGIPFKALNAALMECRRELGVERP